MASDLRPAEYVARFAELAAENSNLDPAIAVACRARPDWLKAVLLTNGAREMEPSEALKRYAKSWIRP